MTKEELEIDNKRLNFNEKVQLVVKKEELKEQDIRLNKLCFDYQEKEKRIADLEAENEQIKNSDTLCKLIGEQKRKITELETQIEKMKCCGNCACLCECGIRGYEECKNFDKWELREIKEK